MDPDAARFDLAASLAGHATPGLLVPQGATQVGVGITGVTDAVVRLELAVGGASIDAPDNVRWFDAGTGLDLDAATPFRLMPVGGALAYRLAIRTAADEQLGVWVGVPA